jgi:hypothetical protein
MLSKYSKFFVSLLLSLVAHQGFAQSESKVFPGATWKADHVLFPGVMQPDDSPPIPLRKPITEQATVTVSKDMLTMTVELPTTTMTLNRICKDDAMPLPIPDVPVTPYSKNLSAWQLNFTDANGTFDSVVYEQAGGGVFTGPMLGTGFKIQMRAQYSILPVGDFPEPPQNNDVQPIPDVPKKEGLRAATRALGREMNLDLDFMEDYIFAGVTKGGNLQIKLWLGKDFNTLSSDRDITDPCDPRYGNMEPAKYLYVFDIILLGNEDGYQYFVDSKLFNVKTQHMIRKFSPATQDSTYELEQEITDAYRGLGVDVKPPRDK